MEPIPAMDPIPGVETIEALEQIPFWNLLQDLLELEWNRNHNFLNKGQNPVPEPIPGPEPYHHY